MLRLVIVAVLLSLSLARFDYCSISPKNTLCLYKVIELFNMNVDSAIILLKICSG